ncbi:holin [Williamsia phyllosphaerae]|uniref:Holin n=1 Tax=Williamsia phyllosphaerae TaxID=885042 RepID=A0ABQ1V4Z2_9NOCA|nr:holin [Williamsia phyllosphaerae]GGF39215.1 hypothetical protein GCM10007298_38640 [Williamsia phyllosphaerae]
MTMFTVKFWKDAAERLIKTAAQAALGVVVTAPVADLAGIDWKATLSLILVPAVASLLTSVISSGKGNPESASLVQPATGRDL